MTKAERADAVRRHKAKERRYKKAAVVGLTLWEIQEELERISCECDEVTYWQDTDEETLVDALDGDYDEAERFRTDFAVLSADTDRMREDIWGIEEPEHFDDILVASGLGRQPETGLFGYDSYEGDYFGLQPFTFGWAEKESVKRLMNLTKKDLIAQMAQSVAIAFAYIGICTRYGDLKASMDILRAQNKEYLDSVKEINTIYDQIDWTRYRPDWSEAAQKIDRIAERLPQEAFL